MDAPLTVWIRDRIAAEGPVPFERFMDWALYHPEYGYYASGRAAPGRDEGDFTTAPQLSRLFGRCLAALVIAADEALGRPEPFTLVEGGAGEGRLARDLLDALVERAPELYGRLVYAPEEAGPVWAARQEELLAPHRPRLSREHPAAFGGLYLSNELADAFPVHRLRRVGGELREVFVALQGEDFAEMFLPPSRPELAAHLDAEGVELPEGCEAEVSLRALDWLRDVARRLRRGYVVTIDYGDEAARLYGPHRPRGTCAAYRRHAFSSDLLAAPGEQDLTAHVDFTALRRAGEEEGLSAAPLVGQREFLFSLGFLREVEAMEEWGLSETELLAVRHALAPLLFPGGMGDSFRVLLQSKDVPRLSLPAES